MPALTATRLTTSLPPARLTTPAQPPAHPPAQSPASLSFAALEAAMLAAPYGDAFAALVAAYYDDARVVTGDDGLDHYL